MPRLDEVVDADDGQCRGNTEEDPEEENLGSSAQAMPKATAASAASVRVMKRGEKGSSRGDMGGLVGSGLLS